MSHSVLLSRFLKKVRKKFRTCVAQALLFLFLTAWLLPEVQQACAQTVPAQQNPGVLVPTFSKENLPSSHDMNHDVVMEEIHLQMPAVAPKEADGAMSFLVREIRVEGATLFDSADFEELASPFEGKEHTLKSLTELTDAIEKKYCEIGYWTTQVYIPPQDLRDNVLIIRVREGTLGRLRIEGNKYYKAQVIESFLNQAPGSPLNFKTLEADLNRSNRLNDGYRLQAALKAGEKSGETDIHLKVAERLPFQISPTWDNQGRPFIGMMRGGLEFRNDSVTGIGDRLYARVLAAQGTRVLSGSYALPLNRKGLELATHFAASNVDVDLGIRNSPEIAGSAYHYGLMASQPIDKQRYCTMDLGLSWWRVRSFFEEVTAESNDIRALQAGFTFNRPDRWGRTFNRFQGTLGIGVFGGDTRFAKVENYLSRMIVLPRRNLLILKASAQMTPDALPAVEQFQIGGAQSVRGYTEGLLIGDRGVSVGIEHRFPVPGLKRMNHWLDEHLQAAWFYDFGRVWTDCSSPSFIAGRSDLPQRTLLQGAGVGLRARLTRFGQGFVDVGFGLGDRSSVEPQGRQPLARIHFGIRSDFFSGDYRMRNLRPAPAQLSVMQK